MPLIAVCQTNSSADISRNLETSAILARDAASRGARAMFLPECFALMQTSRRQLRESAEEPGQGVIQDRMASLARETGMMLFAGSLPVRSGDPKRVFNTSMVFDSTGGRIARYDKIHLFDVCLDSGERYLESAYTMPGEQPVVVDSELGRVGLSVCYDLRFPELYRQLVSLGAEVLLVPSAFSPTTGPVHWEPMLRARAIENTCWVIAAAQTGRHPSGRSTWGHSMVVDPWGRVVAEKNPGPGLLMVEIDRTETIRARRQMPSLEHRRLRETGSRAGGPLPEDFADHV